MNSMKHTVLPGAALVLGAAFIVIALMTAHASSAGKGVEVVPKPAEKRVDVLVDGKPFTSYIWPDRLKKPVLYPLRTAGDTVVTRGFPLEPRAGERVDHPHQVGLWFNHGDVNGVDFWNNSEALKPEEAAKMGTIFHRKIVSTKNGASQGALDVACEWVMPDGSAALTETTHFVFGTGAGQRSIDRITTLAAGAKRVVFKDNKEGVFAMRVTRALEEPSTKPEVFTDASGRPTTVAALDNAGVNGVYTSSEGITGAKVWGTKGRWLALAGKVGTEDVVLLMLDHPKNPGYPTYWHARGYGLFSANSLGASVFSEGKEKLDYTLEAGAKGVFRHRLLILTGTFSAEKAEAAWKTFVAEYKD
jgi:hypothetical protein